MQLCVENSIRNFPSNLKIKDKLIAYELVLNTDWHYCSRPYMTFSINHLGQVLSRIETGRTGNRCGLLTVVIKFLALLLYCPQAAEGHLKCKRTNGSLRRCPQWGPGAKSLLGDLGALPRS